MGEENGGPSRSPIRGLTVVGLLTVCLFAALVFLAQAQLSKEPGEELAQNDQAGGRGIDQARQEEILNEPPPAPELVAMGEELATTYACAGCHTTTGMASAGPTWKGLYGSARDLEDQTTVLADEAYIRESITDPGAKEVQGYNAGLMTGAIAGFRDELQGETLDSLVAYIKSLK